MKYEIIKGSEKDFEGAPESALVKIHYKDDEDDFVFAEKFAPAAKLWYADGEIGSLGGYYNYGTVVAERRPITEPVWDGKGLPPVGVECEIKRVSDWFPVTIKFISGYYTVILTRGGTEDAFQTSALQFRRIRSPEDVARDKAISEMLMVEGGMPDSYQPHELAAALFDAGYRKME